ncbi:MAG: ribbon-helix-helix protein, CopG family [Woeseiaceae bacterium]
MKTLTVRLPETLVAEIDAESRERKLSKSDVVRERLQAGASRERRPTALLDSVADVIGSVDGLPQDLSARKKQYLRATGYGRKHSR